MIIVVKRYYSWSAALCEEVRRTDKRIYVRYVRGSMIPLQGRSKNWYVDLDGVISDNATEAEYEAVERAVNAHNHKVSEMSRQIDTERFELPQKLRDLIKQ